MNDDLDDKLAASAPRTARRADVADELTALAYGTERAARIRFRRRMVRIGIPVLIGALLVGGGTTAFASPAVRQTLGLSAPHPTPTPAPTPSIVPSKTQAVAAPYPNCTISFTIQNGRTSPLDQAGKNAIAAAQVYLAHVNQQAILRSPQFLAQFGKPLVVSTAPGASSQMVDQAKAMAAAVNSLNESRVLGDIINTGLMNYLQQRIQAGESLEPSAVGLLGTNHECGTN